MKKDAPVADMRIMASDASEVKKKKKNNFLFCQKIKAVHRKFIST